MAIAKPNANAKSKAEQPGPGYEQLRTELDAVLARLQQGDLDIDQALEHYERGLELVKQLETYLKNAENDVTELKAKFNKNTE